MNTREYLDAIRARYQVSDYKAAKMLGVTKQAVSGYRGGYRSFTESAAIRAAELLELDPAEVLVDVLAERTKEKKAREILLEVARSLHRSAAAALMIAPFLFAMWTASPPRAEAMSAQDSGMYIMSNRRRMALAA